MHSQRLRLATIRSVFVAQVLGWLRPTQVLTLTNQQSEMTWTLCVLRGDRT